MRPISWADFFEGLKTGAKGDKRASFWGSGLGATGNAFGFISNAMGWAAPDKPQKLGENPTQSEKDTYEKKLQDYKDYKRDTSAISATGNLLNVGADISKAVGTYNDKSEENDGWAKFCTVGEGISSSLGHAVSAGTDIFSALHYGGNLTKKDKDGNVNNMYSDDDAKQVKKIGGIVGGAAGLAGNVFGAGRLLRQYINAKKEYNNNGDPQKLAAFKKKARVQLAGTIFSALGNAGKLWGAFSDQKGDTAHIGGAVLGGLGQIGGMIMGGIGMHRASQKAPPSVPAVAGAGSVASSSVPPAPPPAPRPAPGSAPRPAPRPAPPPASRPAPGNPPSGHRHHHHHHHHHHHRSRDASHN